MARRFWDERLETQRYYEAYAATQAAAPRASKLAGILADADLNRRLLATWDGKYLPDGHATNRGFAGDYSEAFTIESGFTCMGAPSTCAAVCGDSMRVGMEAGGEIGQLANAFDQMRLFSRKQWPTLPFHAEDVERERVGPVLQLRRP